MNMERILARLPGKLELYSSPLEQAQVHTAGQQQLCAAVATPDGLPLHYLMRVEQGKRAVGAAGVENLRLPGQVFLRPGKP